MKKILLTILTFIIAVTLTACKKEIVEEPTVVVDYAVLNSSFEEGMDQILDYSWDTFQSDTMYQISEEVASEQSKSIESTSFFGGFLSIWQVIPIEGSGYRNAFDDQFSALQDLTNSVDAGLPVIGDKVELSFDLFIKGETDISNTMPFLIYVESEDINGKKTIIAESEIVDVDKDEWFTLTTVPAANDGIIPDDAVLIVISCQINIPEDGIVFVDNAKFGKRVSEDEIPEVKDEVFASTGGLIDVPSNSFENSTPFIDETEITYNSDAYYGENSISLNSNKSVLVELDTTDQITNEYLSAGVWVKTNSSEGESGIQLEAFYDDSYHLVSKSISSKDKVWEYLKTDLSTEDLSDKDITKLKVTLFNDKNDNVKFDLLQVGDYQAFNGNPKKLAFIAYQPWYASESDGWGNWQYTGASNYEGGKNSYPSRYIDGQRDIASVYYPVIGAYDSTDPEVIEYHLDLIKAMNIDVVQVNYYADLNQNMLEALRLIFELAEEKELKVSILYEPKIHIYNWINHSTRMDALAAVEEDIANFLDRYGDSKALLKYNGDPLVEIFGVNIIRNSEWAQVVEGLNEDGYNPLLIGDSIENSDYSSMLGMFQWNLYNSDLEDASISEFKKHIETINNESLEWSNLSVGSNIPFGLVYPGFDDTKILGWDLGLARKINLTGPELYQASWDQFQSMSQSFDWVLVATFNDWNEGTIIEPEVDWGHQMAFITQKEVAEFKGYGLESQTALEDITTSYLSTRTNQYD